MPKKRLTRKVSLSAINSELKLANSSMTIRVQDSDDSKSGRLRIGRATITWTPKFKRTPRSEKTWDQFINFFLRS
jgi:hypothetical protein